MVILEKAGGWYGGWPPATFSPAMRVRNRFEDVDADYWPDGPPRRRDRPKRPQPQQELSPAAREVLGYLPHERNAAQLETIVADTGWVRTKLRRAVRELVKAGLVHVAQSQTGRLGTRHAVVGIAAARYQEAQRIATAGAD